MIPGKQASILTVMHIRRMHFGKNSERWQRGKQYVAVYSYKINLVLVVLRPVVKREVLHGDRGTSTYIFLVDSPVKQGLILLDLPTSQTLMSNEVAINGQQNISICDVIITYFYCCHYFLFHRALFKTLC